VADERSYRRIAVNPMTTFALDFEEEAAVVASLPTPRMGVLSRKLDERGWDEGVAALSRHGVEVPYLIHGIFSAPDDDAGWVQEADLLGRTVELAADLGAGFVYMCTGPAWDLRWEEAVRRLGERLAPVAERAAALGVDLVVENSMSIWAQVSFVFSVRDAVELARRIGLGLCLDLGLGWMEADLAGTIAGAADLLHLVQVGDRDLTSLIEPDRRVPGDGDLPLDRLLGDVLATGYAGLFDVELFGPRIDQEGPASALRRGVDWLADALTRLTPTGTRA
jgi:sugar phosphate isomerase/epimerase